LNKEETLVDLLHQAAAMCEQITLEKRQLVTKEKGACIEIFVAPRIV
jgi:hypothetical protein